MPFDSKEFRFLYLRETHPDFISDNLRVLEAVLNSRYATEQQIQAALNRLTVLEAKQYENAIQYLVNEKPNLEYVALEFYYATYQGVTQAKQVTLRDNTHCIQYASKFLRGTAKIFSITPPVEYDRGFIQVCTSRDAIHTYTDDQLNTQGEIPGGFPIVDSGSFNDIPWYCVGTNRLCTYPSARRNLPLFPTETYEFIDSVSGDIPIKLNYTKNNKNKITFIEEITRRQMFYVWFAYRRTASLPYRILTAMTYGFDFTIAPGYQLTFPKVNITPYVSSSNYIPIWYGPRPSHETIAFEAFIPPIMNDAETYYIYVNNVRWCKYTEHIFL